MDHFDEHDIPLAERLLEIPYQQLSANTLMALIEEYVTRDGTDYGAIELTLEQKREQIHQKLVNKELVICFDPVSEEIDIIDKRQR